MENLLQAATYGAATTLRTRTHEAEGEMDATFRYIFVVFGIMK